MKLLRFLKSGEIQRLGDNEPIIVDVRVICATNRDLRQMIAEGQFREDLLFRLNMFHIHLPPLRDRTQDIPDLARHLLARRGEAAGGGGRRPADAGGAAGDARTTTGRATSASWRTRWSTPGSSSGGQPITPEHLPHDVRNPRSRRRRRDADARPQLRCTPRTIRVPPTVPVPDRRATAADRRRRSRWRTWRWSTSCRCTRRTACNKQATATELGISLKTLYNKLHKYEEERRMRAG